MPGFLRPDRSRAEGFEEASRVGLLRSADWPGVSQGDVALVFDYEILLGLGDAEAVGEHFDYFRLVFEAYKGLRQLGLSVDFLSPDMACARLDDYALTLIPGLFTCSDDLAAAVAATRRRVILGPRMASKTADFQIPAGLPPGLPDSIRPARITRVESLADGICVPVDGGGGSCHLARIRQACRWRQRHGPDR